MDLVSALSGINPGNALAGIASSAFVRGDQPVPASSSASTEPSARVFFSQSVSKALAQQSENPGLSIDALIARNLAGLVPGLTGGQLYTASGLLQQFATSLLVAQVDGEPSNALPIESFTDLSDASRQVALQANESLLATVPQGDTTTSVNAKVAASRNAEVALPASPPTPISATPTIEPDAVSNTELATTPEGPNSTPVTAVVQQNSDVDTNTTVLDTTAQASGQLDPYVQAALIGGLTSAGKEQQRFVQAAANLLTESAIAAVAAISRVPAIEGDTTDTSVFA